jgi:hypothetical protein
MAGISKWKLCVPQTTWWPDLNVQLILRAYIMQFLESTTSPTNEEISKSIKRT